MQTVQTPRGANTLLSGFRNEAELTELLGLVGVARMRSASVVAVEAPEPESKLEPTPEPVSEPDPVPKSRNHIFTAYLEFELELSRLSAEQGHLQKLLFGEDWSTIVDSPSTQASTALPDKPSQTSSRLPESVSLRPASGSTLAGATR